MKIQDALNILGIRPEMATQETIKQAYRDSCKKFHPDLNPMAGEEMIKLLNNAYDALRDYKAENFAFVEGDVELEFGEKINNAIKILSGLDGVTVEICGSWVWVSGNTYPVKNTLKESGFKFAPQKKSWYFRPENWTSASRGAVDLEKIRDLYGSTVIKTANKKVC